MDSLSEIIDVDEEEKRAKTWTLWNTYFYVLNFWIHTINPTELFPVGKVRFKPREFPLLHTIVIQLFAEDVKIYSVKCLFEVNEHQTHKPTKIHSIVPVISIFK